MSGAEKTPLALGSRNVTVEPFSGRKALRAFKLLRGISEGAPEIMAAWLAFERDYERDNVTELSRSEALFEFPPLRDEKGEVVRPGRLDHLTDEDWAASGNKIRLPKSPTRAEQIAAVFPAALDLAEQEVLRLLALVAMSNDDVKANRQDIEGKLDELAEEIIDAPFENLLELAVLGGEAVDEQYTRKSSELGDRLGNALKLVGVDLEKVRARQRMRQSSSTARPTSPSDSPEGSDGDPTRPSTPTSASSSALTTA